MAACWRHDVRAAVIAFFVAMSPLNVVAAPAGPPFSSMDQLYGETGQKVIYADKLAKDRLGSLILDCGLYGFDGRYVSAETLARIALVEAWWTVGDDRKDGPYIDVHDTITGLFVDTVDPHLNFRDHFLVADNSGRVMRLKVEQQALVNICSGRWGPLTASPDTMSANPWPAN